MSNEMETRVRAVLKNTTENDQFDGVGLDEDLFALGINSVMFIRAIIGIEQEFDIEFEDEDLDFNKYNSLQKLMNYIDERLQASA